MSFPPRRIVCLTEETVETLYLLGEEARIVGVSGYAVRPARVRKEKPRVSAFISADVPKVLALAPDLVLAFSDMQADIAAALVRAGVEVHVFNQRSIAGILDMIASLGAMVGRAQDGRALGDHLRFRLDEVTSRSAQLPRRPRVYFEEWDEPAISGIGWVSELIGIAGGDDVFADKAGGHSARERIVTNEAILAAAPDIVFGSWCGKKFRPDRFAARPGFSVLPAVAGGHVHEIKSPLILQPGPAALTDGLDALVRHIEGWAGQTVRSR
ncbi:MAG: cobalamin-binding protein [Hyphomicrobiaceae bacterium]|nr:cobalamin-binding protein [Hyphomicrobiaceae bacterium]